MKRLLSYDLFHKSDVTVQQRERQKRNPTTTAGFRHSWAISGRGFPRRLLPRIFRLGSPSKLVGRGHPRGPDFPILSQSAFRVAHVSWNSALAEATSRVDAVLDGQLGPEPNLPTALQEVLEAAWNIVASKSRIVKSGQAMQMQLRLALARCIVALEANGITDPTELRRRAVERIVLGEGVESSAGSSLVVQ